MKLLKDVTDSRTGVRKVTVELADGEELIAIDPDSFYRMGEPIDDVFRGHIITGSVRVTWDSIEQKWIE